MIPNHLVLAGIGGLVVVLSIPLILGMVPRNPFYGIRIPKAFESDESWYDINAYGGKLLLVYGVVLLVFAGVTRDIAPSPRDPLSVVYVAGPLLLVFVVLGAVVAHARRLP
jgi:hypothetical protein